MGKYMIQNNAFRAIWAGILLITGFWGLAGCSSTPPESQPASAPTQTEVPQTTHRYSEPASQTTTAITAETTTDVELLKRGYPDRYVVKKGDTLWAIAARFLKSPWLWPEVWNINPKIHNPHLIYPGDVVLLHYVEGKPYLTLESAGGAVPPPKGIDTVKLSPKIRVEHLSRAITTIPRTAIEPFLYHHRVVSEDELEAAPYIVATFEQHLIAGTGNIVYARNMDNPETNGYQVLRPGAVYTDPDSHEILGYEALNLGESRLMKEGDPSTLKITRTYLEILKGDRLLPLQKKLRSLNFLPRAPDNQVHGYILSVLNGVNQIGQFNVVVTSLGKREGMKVGDVLAIYQRGVTVRDQTSSGEPVKLPDEKAGLLMVFRVYDKVSYALVMSAERSLHVLDILKNPS